MKSASMAGSVLAGGVLLGLSGCAVSKFYQADDPALTSRVWNLPYNYTYDTGPGTKRGVFMHYMDGKPISFTRPGAVLSPGHSRIEVQCCA
jgi:nucleoside-specific outer membrane channel protein Tsx